MKKHLKKHQTPNTKLQRSSNNQSSNGAQSRNVKYEAGNSEPWILREKAPSARHPFDLEERTTKFGETIIRLCKKLPRSPANDRLINQVVGLVFLWSLDVGVWSFL